MKEINNMSNTQSRYRSPFHGNTIPWIEKLLDTPIDDYRKTVVCLILGPYLINIKKLSYDDAVNIINNWLSKCGDLKRLDQNFNYMIRYVLKNSVKNGYTPLKFDTLKMKNLMLYDLLSKIR
jgi:Primase X